MADYVNVYHGGLKDGLEEQDSSPTPAEFYSESEATQENGFRALTYVYKLEREEPQADRMLRHYQYVQVFLSKDEALKFVDKQTGRVRKPRS
jgi:hypothetical protein